MSFNLLLTTYSPYTAILSMLFITFRVMNNRDIIYKNPWNTGLLLLFIWSFLVGIANDNPYSSAASIAILFYFFISVYLQNYYCEEKKIEKLLKNIILLSICSAFIGILEKITAIYCDSIWWGSLFGIPSKILYREGYRIYSTFGNPNVAGAWFAAIILVCIYFYDNSQGFKKVSYGAAAFLFVTVLIMTGSRGAALGLEFALVVYAFFNRQRKNIVFLMSVFICILILMFILPQIHPASNALSSSLNHDVGNSVSNRKALWLAGLNMFKLKPLTGWGLLGIYFANGTVFYFHTSEPHAHNIWITIIATLGIVGLCIYIYMKHYLFDRIMMLHRQGCTLVPLLASIQALVIGHGLVDFTIMTPQGGILFFGCSALISALAIQYSHSTAGDGFGYYYNLDGLMRQKL